MCMTALQSAVHLIRHPEAQQAVIKATVLSSKIPYSGDDLDCNGIMTPGITFMALIQHAAKQVFACCTSTVHCKSNS